MKRYFAAVLLLIPIMFSGCYKQDLSLCGVDENLILIFELREGNNGENLIAEKIDIIDVVLFDENNEFVKHITLTKEQFINRNKVGVAVEPGLYRVVAWGNALDNTLLSGPLAKAALMDSYLENMSGESGDPLYYGPRLIEKTGDNPQQTPDHEIYEIVVPQGEQVEKEVPMVRAHRTVRVWIKGLAYLHDHDVQPTVQLTEIPHRYDFLLNAHSTRKNHKRATEEVSRMLKMASFTAPIADFSADMFVNILCSTSNDQLIPPISILDFVENNVIEDINDFDIVITVSKTAEVTISLPDWDKEEVGPIKD